MPFSFIPKNNERGIATLALVLLLVVGLMAGVFLVQQRTNFLPQAKVDPTSSSQIKRDPLLGVRIGDPTKVDKAIQLGVAKFRVSVEAANGSTDKALLNSVSQIAQSAKTNNIQLVVMINPGGPIDSSELESRITKLATDLGSYNNVVFELGNEPNGRTTEGGRYWNGDYASFATFVKEATVSIRKHWSSTPIIIGALDLQGMITSPSEVEARAELNRFLDAISAQTNLSYYDYAIHSYHEVSWVETIYQIQKEELSKRGISPKLWVTELGTSPQYAQNLVSMIEAAESKSDVKGVIIHSLDSTDDFRLLEGNTPLESYIKVQEFVKNNPKSATVTVETKGSGTAVTGTGTPTGSPPTGTGPAVNAADKSCGNDPVAPPSSNLVWHAFCNEKDYATGHFTCNTNADCPKNTIEMASGVNQASSNQCVLFKEGSRCIQLRTKAGYKADDPAFDTPNDTWNKNPENIPFGQVGIGANEGTGKGPRADFSYFVSSWEKTIARIKEDQRVKELLKAEDAAKQVELLTIAEQAAKEAKEANEAWLKDKTNAELAKKASDAAKKAADAVAAAEAIRKLAKLEEMLQGKTSELCVKADLGIRPWLTARRLKYRGEDTREDGSAGEKTNRYSRLYVCSGKDSKLKWRVATEGNDNTQDAENENSMERILRLHADSEDSPNYPTPKYPFAEVNGGITTLYGQDEAGVRQSLEIYINAAKAGKAVLDESSTAPAAQ